MNALPKASSHHKRADYALLAERILLHRKALRHQLAAETGLSPGSVTKHAQWLLQRGFLKQSRRQIPSAKKPVDELAIDGAAGTFLAVEILGDRIVAELTALDLQPLQRLEETLPRITQTVILRKLGKIMTAAVKSAGRFGRSIEFAGMNVDGLVDHTDGIIYRATGVSRWEPCQPAQILREFDSVPVTGVWSRIACKAKGVCDRDRKDRHLGYIECRHGRMTISSIRDGKIELGGHGTSSRYVHVSIARRGARCFCGRTGCFYQILKTGGINAAQMSSGLRSILAALSRTKVMLEWDHEAAFTRRVLSKLETSHLRQAQDGSAYSRAGLRLLSAERVLGSNVTKFLEKASRLRNISNDR